MIVTQQTIDDLKVSIRNVRYTIANATGVSGNGPRYDAAMHENARPGLVASLEHAKQVRDKLDLDLRGERTPAPFAIYCHAIRFAYDLDQYIAQIEGALQ